jgi:circadian clock protein KaiB
VNAGEAEYDLTLYVSGASDHSARAVVNVRDLCETHLAGRYRLDVVDVHEGASVVLVGGFLPVPALVRNRPLPVRRIIGDLAATEKVLRALDLPLVLGHADPRGWQ